MAEAILVLKLDLSGQETWRYTGQVLERGPNFIRLEAFFNRPDTPFHGITLATGDRFVEDYYSDRWYNIYQIFDPASGVFKGWYCNVSRPAQIAADRVSYVDLALDLLVFPDRRQLVLDEDEFAALDLDEETRHKAREALSQLQALFL
jgi:uncharacterized protein